MARGSRQAAKAAASSAPSSDVRKPWRVRFSPRVLAEDYDEVGHAALSVARTSIDKKLKLDPRGYGVPLRSPLHGLLKLKVSHVRIVYHVEEAAHEVWVLMIGDRRDIWDQDRGEILDHVVGEREAHGMREQVASSRPKKSRKKSRS